MNEKLPKGNFPSNVFSEIYEVSILNRMRIALAGGNEEMVLGDELRDKAEMLFNQILTEDLAARPDDALVLKKAVFDELFGLGPLQVLLDDPSVKKIVVNGPKDVHIRTRNETRRTELSFRDDKHLLRILKRLLGESGLALGAPPYMLSVELPSGMRVTAVGPPVSVTGPAFTIIKREAYVPLVDPIASVTKEARLFLETAIQQRLNLLITGSIGSGKTTLLNSLLRLVPPEEQVVIIEKESEIDLDRPNDIHVLLANVKGSGAEWAQVLNGIAEIRPDRLVLGELDDKTAVAWIEIANSGVHGCLSTTLGSSPGTALATIEGFWAGSLPKPTIQELLANAFDVIIHQGRLPDGTRQVTSIVQVCGVGKDGYELKPLFEYKIKNMQAGTVVGELEPVT